MNDGTDDLVERVEMVRDDQMDDEKQYDGLNRDQLIERIRQLEEENTNLKSVKTETNEGPKTIYDIPPEILCKIVEPLGFKDRMRVSRTRDLMAKAKHGIVMMLSTSYPTLKQMLSVDRPIKLQVYKKSQGVKILSEKMLNDLIDMGHSLVGFTSHIPSKESLARVVEKVSLSKISQKIDISSKSRICFDSCSRFVHMVNATLIPRTNTRLRDYAFNVAPDGLLPSQTFQYRGATIYIRRHMGQPHEIRLVVKSKNYASASDK